MDEGVEHAFDGSGAQAIERGQQGSLPADKTNDEDKEAGDEENNDGHGPRMRDTETEAGAECSQAQHRKDYPRSQWSGLDAQTKEVFPRKRRARIALHRPIGGSERRTFDRACAWVGVHDSGRSWSR